MTDYPEPNRLCVWLRDIHDGLIEYQDITGIDA